MARSRTRALALGAALGLAAALAGCETSDRDRDRDDDDRRQGDVLGGILGGVLGGGGSGGSGGGGGILGRQVSYRCDDGQRFTASFQPLGQGVTVDTERRTYRLYPRDGDGGGGDRDRREYRSEDGDVRLEVDGDRAELSVEGGDDYEDCEAR